MVVSEPNAELLQQLRELLGDRGLRIESDDIIPDVVLRPETTEQVSASAMPPASPWCLWAVKRAWPMDICRHSANSDSRWSV